MIRNNRIILYWVMLFLLVFASGCSKHTAIPSSVIIPTSEIATSQPGIPTEKTIPTETLTPLPTPTFTLEPTATTIPTSTHTPTLQASPTPEASPTPAITSTPTLAFNLPGFYAAGGCQTYQGLWQVWVDFCVESVEVKKDGSMVFVVSWTIRCPEHIEIIKRADNKNRAMYITDNLGNKYDFIEVGATATNDFNMKNGDTAIGIFVFPRANPGATSFTFHDANQHVLISGIVLINPVIVHELMEMKWYPFNLEYRTALWKPEDSEEGGGLIVHTKIKDCKIQEWEPSQPQGKYKNTIDIGTINYKIYGFSEPGKSYAVREYIAVKGVEGIDPNNPLFFRVYIPWDQSEQCILDASEALATLVAK